MCVQPLRLGFIYRCRDRAARPRRPAEMPHGAWSWAAAALALAAAAQGSAAQCLSRVYSPTDKQANAAFLPTLQRGEDGSFGDARENWHTVVALQRLGVPVPGQPKLCTASVVALRSAGDDVELVGAAAATLRALGCPELAGAAAAAPAALDAVAVAFDSADMKDTYFAVLAAVSLPDGAVAAGAVEKAALSVDGRWAAEVGRAAVNAGFGFASAALAISSGKAGAGAEALAKSLLARAPATIALAEAGSDSDEPETLGFVDTEGAEEDGDELVASLRATSIVLHGLSSLAAAAESAQLALAPTALAKIAAFVLQHKAPGSGESPPLPPPHPTPCSYGFARGLL